MGNALTIELMCSKLPRKKFTPGIAAIYQLVKRILMEIFVI